jgi:hypothetical protein
MPGVNVEITHQFNSGKADGPDVTLVRPSNWNAQLNLGAGSGGHRLIRDPSATRGASWVEPATVRLTNRTGGAHTVGDVVVLDSANDSSVAASSTVNSLKKAFVAMETNADAAAGIYAAEGPVTAKAQGSIARHQYVKLSATTGAVEDAGAAMSTGTPAPLGAVGVALSAAAAGVVVLYLFASTVGGPPVSAGYIKGTGTGYSTQATPIPSADLGSGGAGAGALFLADDQTFKSTSHVLDRVATDTTVTNTTTETTLYSKTIPANTLSTNKRLRLVLQMSWGRSGSSSALRQVQLRFKYGGTTMATPGVIVVDNGGVSIGIVPGVMEFLISADGATNAQIAHLVMHGTVLIGAAAGNLETSPVIVAVVSGGAAVDSTAAQDLVVTAQWNAADSSTITVQHAVLEVL